MRYRALRIPTGLLFLFFAFLSVFHADAQTPSSLTPEQLRVFQSLPPEQQQAILDAMSKSSAANPTDELSKTGGEAVTEGGRREAAKGTTGETGKGAPAPPGPPRMLPQSTVLLTVNVTGGAEDQPELKAVLQDRLERIRRGNPYKLNGAGQVILPSLPPITLWGLTASEASQRLNADPHLAGLSFTVSLLPVAPIGVEALKPFGYELFSGEQSSFAPSTNIPIPTDYPVGPGDTFLVELFGKRPGRYSLVVDRDGHLHLPELGPIEVAGLTFDRVRSEIEQRIAREMIGVRVSVTMGQLRSIRVFVTGDVNRPGSYTVSGLSTVSNALFVSGGVSKIGSLRNVELKRRGAVEGDFDLYALLLNGDSSGDRRLEPGDVVFVPPVGATAGVAGEVRRPAIYEVRAGDTVAELIRLSGGLVPEADPRAAKLERIDDGQQRIVLDIDVSSAAALGMKLRSGDVLTVPRVLDEIAQTVTLEGEVLRPGKYAWRERMHLTDLLSGLNALKENADQRYVLIRREHFPDRQVSVISADAVQAFEAPGSSVDPLLQSRDRVIVFALQADRGVALAELIQQLRSQARDNTPPPVVSISGRTKAPGDYPLEPGMRIGDLIRAGGGLDDAAYALDAELTRFDLGNGASRRTEVIPVDLAAVLKNDTAASIPLKPYDILVMKEVPEWSTQGAVLLKGEVRFPGRYPVSKGETLSSVIRRAGGLTQYAFPEGSVFTREEIKEQERQQIETLAKRMQSDLTTLALQSAQGPDNKGAGEALTVGQSLLAQLRSTQPVGRLVIGVKRAISSPGSEDDVQLRSGDTLTIPRLRQYVTVIGEVQNSTSHIWRHNLDRDDYIDLSGGTTRRADAKRIYVVRADGSVVAKESSRWFDNGKVPMRTGDTIVVPLDAERMRPLPMWQAVTQILYNIAIATAAVHAL